MTSVNISSLRANLYSYADNVLNYGDSLEVRTKKGDLILMSKEEYSSLKETLYLMGFPGTWNEIKEAHENINNEEYWVSEDEVDF